MPSNATVIIPVFNGQATIGGSVHSALSQTLPTDVIVVDDGSSDASIEAALDAAGGDARLKIIKLPENRGPSAARNVALESVSTPWAALLDADDRLAPDRLERLVEIADARRWDFVADDIYRVDDWRGIDQAKRHWRDTPFEPFDLNTEFFVLQNIPQISGAHRELGYIKPMMRTETIRSLRLRYDENMRLGEDFDFYVRALAGGAAFGMAPPMGYYALDRPGSLSKLHRAHDLENCYRADTRLLKIDTLSVGAKGALRRHRREVHKRWAWARLIEAKKAWDLRNAIGAFMAPPEVIGRLLSGLFGHFLGRKGRST